MDTFTENTPSFLSVPKERIGVFVLRDYFVINLMAMGVIPMPIKLRREYFQLVSYELTYLKNLVYYFYKGSDKNG
ncbi:hypothetical protein [Shimazuella alba]|uniref:Uncharacterized protein n=1 Tax=Shimazuella alba TaxID=2690964 RepID=A0A6I4VMF2_9BACL|nr:hypothetical protein [Shimazuella alba]MXQ52617.1 hypothetical protein [Shimazuella alba]